MVLVALKMDPMEKEDFSQEEKIIIMVAKVNKKVNSK